METKKEKELQELAMEKNGIFNAASSFNKLYLEDKSIIRMNQDLMVFILETISLKK